MSLTCLFDRTEGERGLENVLWPGLVGLDDAGLIWIDGFVGNAVDLDGFILILEVLSSPLPIIWLSWVSRISAFRHQ